MKIGKKRHGPLILLFSFVVAASMLMFDGAMVFADDTASTAQQTAETVENGTAADESEVNTESTDSSDGQSVSQETQAENTDNTGAGSEQTETSDGNTEEANSDASQAEESVDDSDTVIKDSTSLQKAIDDDADGDTIELENDIVLDSAVSVSGKSITIASKDGANVTISASSDNSSGKLISVASGAGLTLRNITLDGNKSSRHVNGALIDDEGTLVFEDGTVVQNVMLESGSSGAVRVKGSDASFTMNGGKITGVEPYNSSSQIWYSGSVLVTDGASFTMNGGEITGNSWDRDKEWSAVFCTSGVFIDGGASFTMNGGSISNNKADRGSALHIYNGSAVINGGTISNNEGLKGYSYNPDGTGGYLCGAVMVYGSSSLTVSGGTISGNTSAHAGGAITVAMDGSGNEPVFNMTGGEISNNTAEHIGGGIYIYSNKATLTGGKILNNTAGRLGGGVYVEGNNEHYTTTKMANVLITDNSASVLGGGLWTCPSGSFKANASESVAIFDNSVSESGAGSDVASVEKNLPGVSLSLSNRMLGGGKVTYYKDGGISYGTYGASDGTARYDASNPGSPVDVSSRRDGLALKAVTVSEDAKTLARNSAKLVISGNTAKWGGGIGANGGVEIGSEAGTQKVTVKKVWDSSVDQSSIPDSIVVDILANGSKIDEVTLNENNNWTAEITDIPAEAGTITASEHSYDGFTESYDIQKTDEGYEITVTNKKEEPTPEPEPETTELSVQKVWENDTAEDRPDSIEVQLIRNGEAYGDPVELSEDNSWQHTWTGLDKSYDWSVEESDVPDGYNSVTAHDGTEWTITNTKTTPGTPEGENPRPVTPDESTPTTPSGGNGRTVTETSKKTVTRKEIRTPGGYVKTGDSKDALLYTAAFTAAAAGAIYISIRRRKKGAER
jgi:hypothetical protein